MVWILLTSLIWWDHPNLFNHLSLPYIKRDFSWKRLRLMKVDVGTGVDPGFNALTNHQQNPNYRPFR
jgi:hypothetical protein